MKPIIYTTRTHSGFGRFHAFHGRSKTSSAEKKFFYIGVKHTLYSFTTTCYLEWDRTYDQTTFVNSDLVELLHTGVPVSADKTK